MWRSSWRPGASKGLRSVTSRCALLALLVVGHAVCFTPLHAVVGNPAFLVGVIPCLAAAVLFGLRGALVVVVLVQVIDGHFALAMPGAETGAAAGVIAVLSKLLVAGGLGMAIDTRRRVAALNAQLSLELGARKQSEESLRHSEELYRVLVESLGEGVGLFDGRDRVVFANPALSSTLAVPAAELRGRSFSDCVVMSSDEASPGSAAAEDSRSYEVTLRNSASTVLLVTETKLVPGGPRGAVTLRVIRDLTERIVTARRQQDLERELQRSQALQSLAVMAGGVAHDFNNLLCGVVGNAQVAQRKVPPDAPPLLSHCLAEILNFAGEAAQLSKQMLAYAGKRSLGIAALELNSELNGALRLLHATVSAKARLVLELGGDLPEVAADRFQLRQVVTNLVLNALDAMEGKRGLLTLRTGHVRLEADDARRYSLEPGSYVKLSVEDTGTGVAPEARERLFEPFFSTKAPGRGMGLAAAAGIVRTHRGWIGIDNTSELGTRFGILLPVAHESTPRPKSSPVAPVAPLGGCNILLIDDEPAVRIVTGRLLNELGHRVLTAESGQRGLELFGEQRDAIDLVVLDLTMPEAPGEQILEELRQVRGDVPVVITSGFQAQDASKLLRVPNVIGFLDKPHTLSNLELALAALGSRPVSARVA
jgi:two-component system, cell cycle sensor histidine kinase and response regulator CckA